MSPRTSIIALNLGSQTVELAKFRVQPSGGLILDNYCTRDLPLDPAQERTRLTQIAMALGEMQTEWNLTSGLVNYTVAEELIFTRFVELPSVEPDKIERIVSFEAQQNVPFPIDEVIWDYQVVGSNATGQMQVILAAIKCDLIEEINQVVEAAGLRTSIVDLATMTLYNAFRHSYGEPTGCSLLIDIGARTTNLVFIEPGRVFTRSVAIGGSSVTSALAKEFNESFDAAELRKRRTSVVLGTINGANALTDDATRVSKIVQSTLTRMHAEVQRSISHYCAQQKGRPPERVFLSGGGAGTPAIREFFRDKLQVQTEFFDALRNVTVAESACADEIRRSAHLLGEPVGLALRSAADCAVQLSLCPKSVVLRKAREKRRPCLLKAAACLFGAVILWGSYWLCAARVIRAKSELLEGKIAGLHQIEAQLNQVHAQVRALDRQTASLVDAINGRSFWTEVIEELNARLPAEGIWVTELIGTSGGSRLDPSDPLGPSSNRARTTLAKRHIDGLFVSGLYLFNPKQQEVVVDYFHNLAGSRLFAIDVKKQAKVIKPTTPTNIEWAFPYELRLEVRKPIGLP
jgi:type IV pilus assembly protein PilM